MKRARAPRRTCDDAGVVHSVMHARIHTEFDARGSYSARSRRAHSADANRTHLRSTVEASRERGANCMCRRNVASCVSTSKDRRHGTRPIPRHALKHSRRSAGGDSADRARREPRPHRTLGEAAPAPAQRDRLPYMVVPMSAAPTTRRPTLGEDKSSCVRARVGVVRMCTKNALFLHSCDAARACDRWRYYKRGPCRCARACPDTDWGGSAATIQRVTIQLPRPHDRIGTTRHRPRYLPQSQHEQSSTDAPTARSREMDGRPTLANLG